MVVLVCIMFGVILFMSLFIIAYHREVKNICRWVSFLKQHESNMLLTAQLPFRELKELTENVNDLIATQKKLTLHYKDTDEQLKETITSLSHDIRTPLTSLSGYFQLLAQSKDEAERSRYTAIIQNRIRSLHEILEELFTYAKLQDHGYAAEMEHVDFSAAICTVLFSFLNDFQEKGTEPQANIPEGSVHILANAKQLQRALTNIVKNSLEHGNGDLSVNLTAQDTDAVLEIANVIPVDADPIDPDKVFDRFYKADRSRAATSTGLGLSIAKSLVEQSGGAISADVENGLFKITVRYQQRI
ncbi:MAG: HAMP domain-containing sensor histidine kinase [Oscillospiraceae bacterium]